MDHVVDDYAPVLEGLANDVDEMKTDVFGGNTGVSRRIYELSREAIQFGAPPSLWSRCSSDLVDDDAYDVDPGSRRYLRDVRDHAAGHRQGGVAGSSCCRTYSAST